MAWYHQYRYAEVVSADYPKLHHRALPITHFEISTKHNLISTSRDPEYISRVNLLLDSNTQNTKWFVRDDCILYKGQTEFSTITEEKHSIARVKSFFRKLRLTF